METMIVTGAGSGIGHALTRRLLAENYHVSAWDTDSGDLAGTNDDNLDFCEIDVRDANAMAAAVAQAEEKTGKIAGLATCAAIYRATPFLELTEDDWDAHLSVNLKGTMLSCQAVLPTMLEQKSGSIVLFSSSIARRGAPQSAAYATTKGGVLGLGRAIALDHARAGIRANIVSPGITDTPQPRGNLTEDDMYGRAKNIPLGRIGQPQDMVETALFLLSDDASFVTGQDLRVNGGAGLF
ncbi:MAG: SDR family NAD(P)-dependent oxidoreductase [Alphaproteobacteria bacterium]|nr:SDR family NAD(P)-dependent oxidoreductase [Alphaproteobacteria bacterium]